MTIRMKVLNRLRMLKQPIAAEIESSRSDCRAWISIYMYQKSEDYEPMQPDAPWVYQVVRFDAEKKYLEDPKYREAIYFDEVGIENYVVVEFLTEEEALAEVSRWLDDLGKLDTPSNCGYPI